MGARWMQVKMRKLRRDAALRKRKKAHGGLNRPAWKELFAGHLDPNVLVHVETVRDIAGIFRSVYKPVSEVNFANKAHPVRTIGAGKPKREVTETLHMLWQNEFRQGIDKFNHVRLDDEIRMFFSGEKFVFIRSTEYVVAMSYMYKTRRMAMLAYQSGRIAWKEVTEPTVESEETSHDKDVYG